MTDSQPSTEVARYADRAMFKAEPLAADAGPSVFFLSMNPDPLGSIAAAALMYKGQVVRDLAEITDQQRREMFDQISKTKLKAPFEFVKLHMLLENVHRGLTHQLVRQRTAVYAQESMRFAVKEGIASTTHLPPSLADFRDPENRARVLQEREDAKGFHPPLWSEKEKQFLVWWDTMQKVEEGYDALINSGMPAEDARGLAPTNISTRVHYSTDLRALSDHAGNRLCTQAQFEWRELWLRIIPAMRAFGAEQTYRGTNGEFKSSEWQFDLIAGMFRPVCYLTGKCEFAAMDLDRACKIRGRVDKFHERGVPSELWGPESALDPRTNGLLDIHPAEWLTDPSAARVK